MLVKFRKGGIHIIVSNQVYDKLYEGRLLSVMFTFNLQDLIK